MPTGATSEARPQVGQELGTARFVLGSPLRGWLGLRFERLIQAGHLKEDRLAPRGSPSFSRTRHRPGRPGPIAAGDGTAIPRPPSPAAPPAPVLP